MRVAGGSSHARAGACTAGGSAHAQYGAALHSGAARQEAGKKLHYSDSEQILRCISGETSRLLAQTLTVLNSDFVGSILKSVQSADQENIRQNKLYVKHPGNFIISIMPA